MKTASESSQINNDELSPIAAVLCADYSEPHALLVYRALKLVWPQRASIPRYPTPIEVASELKALGVDAETLAASLLGAEVCESILPQEEVAELFGERIAGLVKSVRWIHTFREGEFADRLGNQGEEQPERLRRMVLAMVEDVRAVLVKLAHVVVRL